SKEGSDGPTGCGKKRLPRRFEDRVQGQGLAELAQRFVNRAQPDRHGDAVVSIADLAVQFIEPPLSRLDGVRDLPKDIDPVARGERNIIHDQGASTKHGQNAGRSSHLRNSSSSRIKVTEQPAMSREVLYSPT